ncbi:MAG: DUF6456 domain-containing protein [Aliihoeflea sp.]|uniref:DUF6456 domain-containing protein n=1 Tax=Aliihoeflea sp. TaxID=2608088 RepID=UPI004034DC6C
MDDRQLVRLIGFLSKGAARCEAGGRPGRMRIDAGERGAIEVPTATLRNAMERGLAARAGAGLSVSREGSAWLARAMASPEDRFQVQHQERDLRTVEIGGVRELATVNLRESPLAALAQRKDRDGRAFLSAGEVEAGERLRADYGFGQIAPRLSANWEAGVCAGRRGGGNAKADLSDDALAARQRVDRAIDAIGPELSGILVDICCFLKGLEQVETERGWPRRSAKLMLKTALGALARHYHPQRRERRRGMLHWGTADYRPQI